MAETNSNTEEVKASDVKTSEVTEQSSEEASVVEAEQPKRRGGRRKKVETETVEETTTDDTVAEEKSDESRESVQKTAEGTAEATVQADVETANIKESTKPAVDNQTEEAEAGTDIEVSEEASVEIPTEELKYVSVILNRIIPLYRGKNLNSKFARKSGRIHVKYDAQNGFYPVICSIPERGTVHCFAKIGDIPSIN